MKIPFITREKAQQIIKTHPTPFHIYDEAAIRENVRELKAAFSWNPGYKEYFAVKACPNPVILEILRQEGCGVDCASYCELMLAQRSGHTGREIFFSSNETPAQEYAFAKQLGACINLDDFSHIEYLAKTVGLPDEICLRYNPGNDFTVSNKIMDNPGDAKYGMTTDQLIEGFKQLAKAGVKRFGIHSFLASNSLDERYYPLLASFLFKIAAELKTAHGITISYVNLSGGLGIPYLPEDKPLNIKAVADGVRSAYESIIIPAGLDGLSIYTELGRYITGPYGGIVTAAIHSKSIYKEYIGVDACAVDLMRPAMYGAYHHITVLGKENAAPTHTYDIVGSLCENNDKFAIDRPLPKIETGDLLFIHDTGAHGHSMGYNYNGKLKSAELLLTADGAPRLIRRAETPADYFATLDILD